jgi:hypothetical protein
MSYLLTRRALAILAIVAFLTVSTVAVSHGHSDANAAGETRCAMCLAVHSTTHAVAAPAATLCFSPVRVALLLPLKSSVVALVQSCPNQDRAPPAA